MSLFKTHMNVGFTFRTIRDCKEYHVILLVRNLNCYLTHKTILDSPFVLFKTIKNITLRLSNNSPFSKIIIFHQGLQQNYNLRLFNKIKCPLNKSGVRYFLKYQIDLSNISLSRFSKITVNNILWDIPRVCHTFDSGTPLKTVLFSIISWLS